MNVLDNTFVQVFKRLDALTERVTNLERQEIPLGFGPLRVWSGLVTVTTAPAITITEVYNGFSGVTFTGSNVGAGLWNITASSPVLTANQTALLGGLAQSPTGQMAALTYNSTTVARLTTFSAAATPADQNIAGIPVIILVW